MENVLLGLIPWPLGKICWLMKYLPNPFLFLAPFPLFSIYYYFSAYLAHLWLPNFSDISNDKESACNAGDLVLIPGSGRSPGEGNGYTLQYSCLDNSMERGTWWAIIYGVTKSQTQCSNWVTNTFFSISQWTRCDMTINRSSSQTFWLGGFEEI